MTEVTEIKRRLLTIKELFAYDPEWMKKRDRAVKKLFKGNDKEFNELMAKIESLTEWKEALAFLEDEFSKRKIDIDCKEATGLTDVLFKRYFPSY
jgi:hypothetical protein